MLENVTSPVLINTSQDCGIIIIGIEDRRSTNRPSIANTWRDCKSSGKKKLLIKPGRRRI